MAKILGTPFSADPVRIIQTNSLIQMTGYGLYTAGSALYFVRAAGIPAERVGLGFSLAGLAGLALSVRMGRLADRLGPRDVGIAFAFARVALLITAVLIHGTAAFLIVIVCLGIAENGSRVARGALVARLVPKSGRVRTQAMTRVLTNVGFSIGVVVAGVAIAFNTRAAYASLILGMALAALLTALLSFRLPRTVADPAGKGARSGRTRYDFPYMAVSFVSSMTLIGDTVLTVGLPIWVVTHTGIPRPLAAWAILANTVLVIGLQVKFSSLGSTVASARKIQRWAFIVLAAACCAAAATDGRGGLLGSGLLLVTVALLTLGELWGESANWSFRYGFAQAKAQGAYGGMFILAGSAPTVIGPVVVTSLTSRFVPGGWFVLALLFIVCTALNGPVISWAERTRIPDEDEDEDESEDARPAAETTAAPSMEAS
ncbi:MFS transporter [Kitasatospora sp. NBC_01266]|uniref:MFS transporter n=1 Tax=Kitasatospora sp. NBC_01266 TaxID=2903572 RepID=UPI002E318356|nr:MFS transporter [Kitasatospora sp. NBC_01266]